jgi:hypothetical protein
MIRTFTVHVIGVTQPRDHDHRLYAHFLLHHHLAWRGCTRPVSNSYQEAAMRVIYATGQPQHFEFATANDRNQVPADAAIFAEFDGTKFVQHLDDYTFNTMTDVEYYELMSLINEARQNEHIVPTHLDQAGLLHKLWHTVRGH